MNVLAGIAGCALILVVLFDAFETIVLPRRVTRRFRITRLFYRSAWAIWRRAASLVRKARRREAFISFFGPLSLLVLLSIWGVTILTGFALLHWSIGSQLKGEGAGRGFLWDLYFSGSTQFTLGLGDIAPSSPGARLLAVVESGLGLGFLALMIGYVPIIYQAFSRRESEITLMDARAGSPSSAIEMLVRQSRSGNFEGTLSGFFSQWERWSSELLESHLSYPLLAYYRSQHDNQSWLGALTTILDASALTTVLFDGTNAWQAQLTFAMARHAVVDLSQVFQARPHPPRTDRLPPADFERAVEILRGAGLRLNDDSYAERKLADMRRMYEPYVNALSEYLVMSLPPWLPGSKRRENWLTSAWEHATRPDNTVSR